GWLLGLCVWGCWCGCFGCLGCVGWGWGLVWFVFGVGVCAGCGLVVWGCWWGVWGWWGVVWVVVCGVLFF
ncbi:hypothetical protein RA268_27725, partial [Pseudomonas syringae pv. tagetis]